MAIYHKVANIRRVEEKVMESNGKVAIAEFDQHDSYMLVRMDRKVPQYNLLKDVENWCNQCECGKRVNGYSFAFKTEQELLMFKLRWL